MRWKFNHAGQWEGTDGNWHAVVVRLAGQVSWSATVYLALLPEHRHEQHGFADADTARAWCEAEVVCLSASRPARQ